MSADVDITNCDREPIHIPGSVQSHGFMLACDPACLRVLRHSRAAAHELGARERGVNGSALDDIVGAGLAHDLRNALGAASNRVARRCCSTGRRAGVARYSTSPSTLGTAMRSSSSNRRPRARPARCRWRAI